MAYRQCRKIVCATVRQLPEGGRGEMANGNGERQCKTATPHIAFSLITSPENQINKLKQAIPARLPQATRSALISHVRQLITPRLFAITVITDEVNRLVPQTASKIKPSVKQRPPTRWVNACEDRASAITER